MESKELYFERVLPKDTYELLEIGKTTFYDAFGPPLNTEENIQKYLDQNFTLNKITEEILHPESQFFFITYQNDIVGYIKLNFGSAQTEIKDSNAVEVERIYIRKAFQSMGFGQAVFNWIIEVAKKDKMDFIWLGVWNENIRAIKFYKKNGFIPFDTHSFMLGSEKQKDIMMKLNL
ncbi:GNAT family N-acetyltransferase [Aquimarina litoralis]|uniref:GNAT family N-acetyltransferase n=1 Tax=Aquimarina litoralis TaxID=584605 RepID=UPI001C58673F|nr:GNAT family N-acetyltransferase [Aquimarina litoralis]MBW1297641.1 GNAT family N-acetyltransferase [Aquimarina litoralis]